MDLLPLFKELLETAKPKPSLLTVKNYVSDLRNFIQWYEQHYQTTFVPHCLSESVLNEYQSDSKLSTTSKQRRVAALKKFYMLLDSKGVTTSHPFLVNKNTIVRDPWKIKEFKMQLHLEKVSPLTVKNYVLDVLSFKQWAQQSTPSLSPSTITVSDIDCYRDRLIQVLRLSPASVNRKLSSIRRYLAFLQIDISVAQTQKAQKPAVLESPTINPLPISLSSLAEKEETLRYSSFPPLRLLQRVIFSIRFVEDVLSDHAARALRKKQVKQRLPFMITKVLPHLSLPREVALRPSGINRTHLIIVSSCLVLASIFLIKHLFDLNANMKKQVLGIENTVNSRILSFSGRLTDQNGNPITDPQSVRFAIYTDPIKSQPLIWQETQVVKPGSNGQFQVTLGQRNLIPARIFSETSPLYLGVKIGNSPELTPRKQLVSTSYAANAQSLQGMLPITADNAGSQNVILTLNSSGNLIIGKHTDPIFQATEGDITLSGNTTILSTNPGSNGDVQLSPDGTGMIDVQAPIHNSTQNGKYPGAVEIADTAFIQSSEPYQPSLIVDNEGFGDLFSASASGITKFIITRSGSVGIGTADPMTTLDVNGDVSFSGTTRLNNITYQWPSVSGHDGYVLTTDGVGNLTWSDGSGLSNSAFDVADGTAYDISRNVLIGASSATSSASFAFLLNGPSVATASFSGNLVFSGGSQTIAATAMQPLQIGNNTTGSINFQNAGNVGIGTTTPQFKLDVNGTANISGDVNLGSNLNVTGQLNGHNADFAEYVKKEPNETIPYGALICVDGSGQASECTTGGHIIGAASEHPAFLGNADNSDNSIAVGLIGQIPVKISDENGPIKAGDPVGASSIPGVGAKATTAGFILGHALVSADQAVNGEITVLVQPSWYDPSVYLSQSGELHINGDETASLLSPILNNTQSTYTVTSMGQVITRITSLAQATIGTLLVGMIDAQQVIVHGSVSAQTIITQQLKVTSDNIFISGLSLKDYIAQVISQVAPFRIVGGKPQVFANQVTTNIISPLADDSHITVSLTNSQLQIKKDASSSAVTSFDTQGNATFSGTLTAQAASVSGILSQDATVSGTLRAGTIIANSIQGLGQQVATIAASYLRQHQQPSPTPTPAADQSNTLALTNATAGYSDTASMSANFGMFNQSLISMGTTTLRDATIMDQLSIGTGFIIGENSLDTIGQDLQIEPLRQGNVSFMAGLISIDTKGNLKVEGNADFAQNVTVNGWLAANIISPLPNQNLTINLGKKSDGTSQSLQVNNGSKMPVFSVNDQGDVYSTGSAYFGQNLVASGAALLSKLNIFPAKAEAVSDTEVVASGSAGMATLKAYEREVTIDTPEVTAHSLIYITPEGNTNNQVLYLERQVPGKSFTVGVEQTTYNDIPFNWIIVN